ncbi:hypothetical protein [Clostridium sp. CCUG 7971]|nr:hypothetical protein [Clostridium sp. CCUG 7971]
MKIKKFLGGVMLLLSAVVVNAGVASMALVGTEEMPQSMKNKR